MDIGWNYALNFASLPRGTQKVSKNGKNAMSAICAAMADLSSSGYGMKIPKQNQSINPGITHADPSSQGEGGEEVVAPPGNETGVVAPPTTEVAADPRKDTIDSIRSSAKALGYNCDIKPKPSQNSYSVRFYSAEGSNMPEFTAQFDAITANNAKAIVGAMSSLVMAGAQEYKKGRDPCSRIEARLDGNSNVQIDFEAQSGEKLIMRHNLRNGNNPQFENIMPSINGTKQAWTPYGERGTYA